MEWFVNNFKIIQWVVWIFFAVIIWALAVTFVKRKEHAAVNQDTLRNDTQFTRLNTWVDKHYRDVLNVSDLSDPQLLIESRTALDELTQLLKLGSVYPFQQM